MRNSSSHLLFVRVSLLLLKIHLTLLFYLDTFFCAKPQFLFEKLFREIISGLKRTLSAYNVQIKIITWIKFLIKLAFYPGCNKNSRRNWYKIYLSQ
jgi:hypothetical protein